MKKIILGLAVLFVLAVTVSCKKKKKSDDGSDRCGEQEIKASTIPTVNTTDPPATGRRFPFTV